MSKINAPRQEIKKYVVITQLLVVYLVTIAKSFRWPNDWAEAHWLLNYKFGFIRRALPGSILSILFPFKQSMVPVETIIRGVSLTLLILFSGVLIWLSYRIVERSSFTTTNIVIVCVFLSSPFVVMSGHINGYFDNIIFLLSILSCYQVFSRKYWLSSLILSLGVLVHETILIVGAPLILFSLIIMQIGEYQKRSTLDFSEFALNLLKIFSIPISIFMLLLLSQNYFINTEQLKVQLITYLSGFPFIQENRHKIVPITLTTSISKYWKTQSPNFVKRITEPIHVLQIGAPLNLLIYYSWQKIQDVKGKYIIFPFMLLIVIIPLSLHIIAWDTSRIWTYPLMVLFLAIWLISEKMAAATHSKLMNILGLTVIAFQIFSQVPLMDNLSERFSTIERIYLYAPILLLLAVSNLTISNNNQQTE